MNVSLSPSAPVVTYKKVYSQFFGEKLTRVFVDGTACYDIFRFSTTIKGFDCFTLEANGNHGHFICGGADVLLREVKEVLEGIILKAYTDALNDASTDTHKEAVDRYVHAMTDASYAISDVTEDRPFFLAKAVVSFEGEEVPQLLEQTFDAIHGSEMSIPDGTQALQDLTNAAKMVFDAQQRLKEAVDTLATLRTRAAINLSKA